MAEHVSHLLQPLDVGCFSPVKRAYGNEIGWMVRHHINRIDKLSFLPAFKAAFERSFTKDNICAGFRDTGLVPFHPDTVIPKLDVKLHERTATLLGTALWEPKTLSNPREIEFQSTLLHDRI